MSYVDRLKHWYYYDVTAPRKHELRQLDVADASGRPSSGRTDANVASRLFRVVENEYKKIK